MHAAPPKPDKPRSTLPRAESLLPFVIGLAWWTAMYPGLFGEDSIINLSEATNGPVTVWFTAWWIYLIRIISIGGRHIAFVTLFGVLTLVFAVREWVLACFPSSRERTLSLCVICATPLIGALGIQIRHDIPM